MNIEDIFNTISKTDFNLPAFTRIAIDNEQARGEMIRQLVHNPDIMVYYHCFYAIDKASQERPDLYYPYWDVFVQLLAHKNSYHRDFGLTILANLVQVDQEDRFLGIYDAYFDHLHDAKFMTAKCCALNIKKILSRKPILRDRIVAQVLKIDDICVYPENQKALLKCDLLEILEQAYEDAQDREGIERFAHEQLKSSSPKTRKKAIALVKAWRMSLEATGFE